MSRRIYVLAAIAALSVTPATADRECFEGSCSIPEAAVPESNGPESPERMPEVADPPAAVAMPEVSVAPAVAASESAPPTIETEQTQASVAPQPKAKPQPIRPRPQMVVDPIVPPIAQPRYSVDAAPRPRPQPAYQAERHVDRQPERREAVVPRNIEGRRVYHVEQGPTHAAPQAPAYKVDQGPSYGVVVVPQYDNQDSMVLYPHVHLDPAWKRCQIDGRVPRATPAGDVVCVPASYHPYGSGGYRPNGTYRPYQAPGMVVTAPDARIIEIERY